MLIFVIDVFVVAVIYGGVESIRTSEQNGGNNREMRRQNGGDNREMRRHNGGDNREMRREDRSELTKLEVTKK